MISDYRLVKSVQQLSRIATAKYKGANGWIPASLLLLSVLCALFDGSLTGWLRYERQPVLDGQVWRLFTAHLVHLNATHLIMNLAGLLLIWLLYGACLSALAWGVLIGVSAASVSVGLLAFDPQLNWYVGMSGVLHGMIVAGGLSAWRAGDRVGGVVAVGAAGKVIYEQFATDTATAALIGAPVIVDAHLYGLLGGLSVFLLANCRVISALNSDAGGKQHERNDTPAD